MTNKEFKFISNISIVDAKNYTHSHPKKDINHNIKKAFVKIATLQTVLSSVVGSPNQYYNHSHPIEDQKLKRRWLIIADDSRIIDGFENLDFAISYAKKICNKYPNIKLLNEIK